MTKWGRTNDTFTWPEFEAKLQEFAIKRNPPVTGPRWAMDIMVYAAAEHPELNSKKRPRGRPRKERAEPFTIGGLLSFITREEPPLTKDAAEEGAALLIRIESIKDYVRQETGDDMTDVETIRLYAQIGLKRSPGTPAFDGTVRTLQSKLSRARRSAFRPARLQKNTDDF